jgi:NADH:ubiquinone oxidoreductase subunit H
MPTSADVRAQRDAVLGRLSAAGRLGAALSGAGYHLAVHQDLVFFFIFSWVKATVPRYRYDQLMRLGWKVFLPTSLFFVFLVSGLSDVHEVWSA